MAEESRKTEILHRVGSFCRANHLLPPAYPPKVIVGLSGGADSVALLSILHELGAHCIAAHCNFHLRGDESDRDQHHCEAIAEKLGVRLLVRHFDVPARIQATGESMEMACRSLRYEWWNTLSIAEGCPVAVGHHKEDNVETFFINLMRGSGLRGLKAMTPRNGLIIRPLLCLSRSDIEDYLSACGLDFITDSSNLSNDITRNRLRNQLLPMLEELFPGATAGVLQSIENLQGNAESLDNLIADQRRHLSDSQLSLSDLASTDPVTIFEILRPWAFNIQQCRSLAESFAQRSSGQEFLTPEGRFILSRTTLQKVDSPLEIEREVSLSEPPFSLSQISREEFQALIKAPHPDPNVIFLDGDTLPQSSPFILRTWRKGDRLQPFGMKGSRLVSDIFSDAKLSAEQKLRTPLLFVGDKLLWVIGMRASRHFPVTPSTRRILKLTYHGGPQQ